MGVPVPDLPSPKPPSAGWRSPPGVARVWCDPGVCFEVLCGSGDGGPVTLRVDYGADGGLTVSFEDDDRRRFLPDALDVWRCGAGGSPGRFVTPDARHLEFPLRPGYTYRVLRGDALDGAPLLDLEITPSDRVLFLVR